MKKEVQRSRKKKKQNPEKKTLVVLKVRTGVKAGDYELNKSDA
jgi:hypothetical protein